MADLNTGLQLIDRGSGTTPCPFCNHHPLELDSRMLPKHMNEVVFFLKCPKCFACGPEVNNRDKVVIYWNSRTGCDSYFIRGVRVGLILGIFGVVFGILFFVLGRLMAAR